MLLVCDSSFVYDFQLGHFMLICYVLDLQNRSKYCIFNDFNDFFFKVWNKSRMFTANNGNKYNTQRARVKTQSVYSNETT